MVMATRFSIAEWTSSHMRPNFLPCSPRMSTTAAVATPPPAVTTPPPRPPPPTALPKQQPDPSCTTDQSNGGRDSPVKETKFRPIRSKTITGRPRSGEVTSSRPGRTGDFLRCCVFYKISGINFLCKCDVETKLFCVYMQTRTYSV